jgi:hypothetical protein
MLGQNKPRLEAVEAGKENCKFPLVPFIATKFG